MYLISMLRGKNEDTRMKSNDVDLVAWPGAFVANFECLLCVGKLNRSLNWYYYTGYKSVGPSLIKKHSKRAKIKFS